MTTNLLGKIKPYVIAIGLVGILAGCDNVTIPCNNLFSKCSNSDARSQCKDYASRAGAKYKGARVVNDGHGCRCNMTYDWGKEDNKQ